MISGNIRMIMLATSIGTLGLASVIASGVLFTHQRILTFIAAALTLLQAHWLLLTLIDRVLFNAQQTQQVFLFGAFIALAGWSFFLKLWRLPYRAPGSGWRDMYVLLLLLVVTAAAVAVASRNGYTNGAYTLRGFYNGDTVTMVSLIQRHIIAPASSMTNPFAANGHLEYPTLLHAGMGNLFRLSGVGVDWIHFLPLLTYCQLLATIPLFFLLFDMYNPPPAARERWFGFHSHHLIMFVQLAIISLVLGLSWDNYIFPQSHFFLLGLYLLGSTLLLQSSGKVKGLFHLPSVTATVITVILLLSNAVTGTSALAGILLWLGIEFLRPKTGAWARGQYTLLAIALLALFFGATPGEAQWALPGFASVAAGDIGRLAPFVAILLAGALYQPQRSFFLSTLAVGLCGLGLVTFFFSGRPIIVANASRFMYHALLVASPLILIPLLRLWGYFRREYIHSSRTIFESKVAWSTALVALLILAMPALASVAAAHDQLMFSKPFTISRADQEIMWWVTDNTHPSDIILTSPFEPWIVPYFTGRSLLRSGHNDDGETPFWLTRDDDTLKKMRAAFKGDRMAQTQLLSQANYLLLPVSQQASWEPLEVTKVFHNQAAVIYRLR